jgi:hypothetical protein
MISVAEFLKVLQANMQLAILMKNLKQQNFLKL